MTAAAAEMEAPVLLFDGAENDDDDDDDDMANLFSFGSVGGDDGAMPTESSSSSSLDPHSAAAAAEAAVTLHSTGSNTKGYTLSSPFFPPHNNNNSNNNNNNNTNATTPTASTTTTTTARNGGGADSPDSFLELLTAESSGGGGIILEGGGGVGASRHDQETQDILDWLDDNDDDDDDDDTANRTEAIIFTSSELLTAPPILIVPPPRATVVPLPPAFATFSEALASKEATAPQIRTLFAKEQAEKQRHSDDNDNGCSILVGTQRAELYCRMICHKSLADTVASSLADSFVEWKRKRAPCDDDDDDDYAAWIRQQPLLSQRIAQLTGRSPAECEADLIHLVLYHHHHQKTSVSPSPLSTATTMPMSSSSSTDPNGETPPPPQPCWHSGGGAVERDVLLPTVATAILSAGISVAAAAVVLSHIVPTFMPLLALPPAITEERWDAALSLHWEFYLLACYHVPLLVFHLDRYLPGWYWPKLPAPPAPDEHQNQDSSGDNDSSCCFRAKESAVSIGRNLKRQGQLPPSWLLCHLAGECGGTMLPDASTLLMLWDGILTGQNNATRFFLTLAVLERSAGTLLLLVGEELAAALRHVWTLEDIDVNKEPEEKEWRHEWWSQALCLQTSTPESVLDRLSNVEDEAIQHALLRRQERAEAAMRFRLEAEAAAYREAQELKADEARLRLSRARLVAFYRKHAPDKEANIDRIIETYAGRLEVLDFKLKGKYGEGFNPAIKAKPPLPPKVPNKLLATMNQGFIRKRSGMEEEDAEVAPEERKPDIVSVTVTAEEVLPVVCWSKEATAARGGTDQSRRRSFGKNRKPLKFYLIDSRSEEAAQQQGRFPTAVSLSPEAMLDPERLQQNEEMFESLRGAVHIVIMGEGFNALPNLYNQKLSPKLQELMEQDESRTNLCALFFQKRGFCFVSLLEGGFCAAHSWLVREGPKHHLNASAVLVDYNPEATLFGQLETLHNASAAEKAQRKMANLLEASLVTMTKRAYQFERLTSDFDIKEGRQGLRKTLFGRSESTTTATTPDSLDASKRSDDSGGGGADSPKPPPAFKSRFGGMGKRDEAVVPPPTVDTADTTAAATESPSVNSSSTATTPPVAAAAAVSAATTPQPASSSTEKSFGPPESSPMASSSSSSPSTTAPNPLGKFLQGGGGGAAANKPKEEAAPAAASNPFKGLGVAFNQTTRAVGFGGGFHSLRKAAMSRVQQRTASNTAKMDEPTAPVSEDDGGATDSAQQHNDNNDRDAAGINNANSRQKTW